MKRNLAILLFALFALPGFGDAIFTPLQYNLLSYSGELIFSIEKVRKAKNTTCYWAGAGLVGSMYYKIRPVVGLEFAIEKRRYFKPDYYKHFFISGYLGGAYMNNNEGLNYIGLVPGFKINYKAQLSKNFTLEPYAGLSVPVVCDVKFQSIFIPVPILTLGVRFNITDLRNRG